MYIENNRIKNYISFWLVFMFCLISIMIVVGGLTRLTDSGLSITEWQLFSGFLPPLSDSDLNKYFNLYKKIPEFTQQNYSMTLEEFKFIFWWEWVHRFLGRLIGILFLLPLIFFTYLESFKKLFSLYLIFFLICFQGFIGWYMVSSGLVDRVDVSHFRLSIHLLIAFIITSLILWNYFNLRVKRNFTDKINLSIPFILSLVSGAMLPLYRTPGDEKGLALTVNGTLKLSASMTVPFLYFQSPQIIGLPQKALVEKPPFSPISKTLTAITLPFGCNRLVSTL